MFSAWLLVSALGGLTLISEDCEGLDMAAVRDELEIELEGVLRSSSRAYGLSLRCREGDIELTIQDPITDKRVTRSIVDPGRDDPDRPRIVALAATRLFTTSWTELAFPDLPPGVVTPPPYVEPTKPEREAVQRHVVERSGVGRGSHFLAAGIGVGWAGTEEGGPQGSLEVTHRYLAAPRFGLEQGLRYQAAGAHRDLGSVYAGTVLAVSGVRTEVSPEATNSFAAGLRVGAGWQDMRGFRDDRAPGGHLGNFAVLTELFLGLRHAGSFPFEVGVTPAWNLGGAIGRFPAGRVRFAGPSIALAMRSSWALGRRR